MGARLRALGTHFNPFWTGMWAASTVALVALLIMGVTPAVFLTAVFALFFVPEMIGIRKRGDSLPPLTYTIRRFVPRWCVDTVVYGLAAWAAISWWPRPHHVLITVAIVAIVGWLGNHFDVTYDGPGE